MHRPSHEMVTEAVLAEDATEESPAWMVFPDGVNLRVAAHQLLMRASVVPEGYACAASAWASSRPPSAL
jgi:hypothetical protein